MLVLSAGVGPVRITHAGPVKIMPSPRLTDKRWSIDLEKRIQEEHFADEAAYSRRYGFNPNSGKEKQTHKEPVETMI